MKFNKFFFVNHLHAHLSNHFLGKFIRQHDFVKLFNFEEIMNKVNSIIDEMPENVTENDVNLALRKTFELKISSKHGVLIEPYQVDFLLPIAFIFSHFYADGTFPSSEEVKNSIIDNYLKSLNGEDTVSLSYDVESPILHKYLNVLMVEDDIYEKIFGIENLFNHKSKKYFIDYIISDDNKYSAEFYGIDTHNILWDLDLINLSTIRNVIENVKIKDSITDYAILSNLKSNGNVWRELTRKTEKFDTFPELINHLYSPSTKS